MKKEMNLKRRIKVALTYLLKGDTSYFGEVCGECNSNKIVQTYIDSSKPKIEGKTCYTVKFMCKECGTTATAVQVWDFEKKEKDNK